jgi:uncharacterized membrane-anchored protein
MRGRFLLGLAVAFAAQAGIVGAMVYSRVSVLQTGQEVMLRSTFVDPRDIFRGHYVRLNLTVGGIDDDLPGMKHYAEGTPAYLTLREGRDGFWIAEAVRDSLPGGTAPVLRAVTILPRRSGTRETGRQAVLPFDRYFADYDRAQELETLRREQKLGVILALDGKGGAVIKGLTIDGERVYDEPLW